MKRREFNKALLKSAAWVMAGGVYVPRACAASLVPSFPTKGATATAGGSCAETYTNDATTASTSFGGGNYYWGQASWQRPAAVTICRLEFELLGNGSSRNWFVAIYTMSGINLNLAGQQAVSAAIPGANWTSATWFGGNLTTPFAPLAATNYALVLFPETALPGNDITSYLDGTTLPGGGNREVFGAAGAAGFAGGNDCSIKIFTQ